MSCSIPVAGIARLSKFADQRVEDALAVLHVNVSTSQSHQWGVDVGKCMADMDMGPVTHSFMASTSPCKRA